MSDDNDWGCFGCFALILGIGVVGAALEALGALLARVWPALLGAGVAVGLWFLLRAVWREAVAEKPDDRRVQTGLAMAPVDRKLWAAAACAGVGLLVFLLAVLL